MTPQQCPASLNWQINSTASGFEKDTHPESQTYRPDAAPALLVPWSRTDHADRGTATQTMPNHYHVSTNRWEAIFCQDEPESFHAWQFCGVRWEAEKIRRQIERRHPRPCAEIAWTWSEPDPTGRLQEKRYPIYSLA